MLPRRQAGLKIFTDGQAGRGPVGRRRRAFQKIWSMHLHFAIWNFLLPDQPKSPSTAEKPCLNFFFLLPGLHSDNVGKSLHIRSRSSSHRRANAFLFVLLSH